MFGTWSSVIVRPASPAHEFRRRRAADHLASSFAMPRFCHATWAITCTNISIRAQDIEKAMQFPLSEDPEDAFASEPPFALATGAAPHLKRAFDGLGGSAGDGAGIPTLGLSGRGGGRKRAGGAQRLAGHRARMPAVPRGTLASDDAASIEFAYTGDDRPNR